MKHGKTRRPRRLRRSLIARLVAASALVAGAGSAAVAKASTAAARHDLEGLRPELLALAESAADRYVAGHAVARPGLLTVIDYSLPSTEPRLWLIDRTSGRVLRRLLVAHGRGSGENYATRFSNRDGSLTSSLGLFLTEEPYVGKNGYSLRLRGLEPGINDRARERTIVLHGAPYVSAAFARAHGRLGRSWGCPAVEPEVTRPLIEEIRDGSFLFVYGQDPDWLARSPLLVANAKVADGAGTAGTP